MLHVGIVQLLIMWGCAPEAAPDDRDPRPPDEETDLPDDTAPATDTATLGSPTGDTGTATGATGDTGAEVVVDCAALAATPLSFQVLPTPVAYHGLAFDAFGNLIGLGPGGLVAYDYYGGSVVYAPGVGATEQMDMAPSGNLYAATGVGVVEVLPNGSQAIVGSVTGYGLKVGPDGRIYVADNSAMYRIDVAAGVQEVYLGAEPGWSPRVMDWSPDLTKMYVGQLFGDVYVVDLDANFDPIGPPQMFAPLGTSYQDGMLVDVCGNVYVTSFSASEIVRISPDGVVTSYVDSALTYHAHGMQFGSGIGGWRADALYVPQPYNNSTVSELVIGVYHRSWQGTVLNGP